MQTLETLTLQVATQEGVRPCYFYRIFIRMVQAVYAVLETVLSV